MHPRNLTPPVRIGILGGGQLAQMLVLKAYEMGLRPFVYCQSLEEPAAQVARDVSIGDPNQSKELEAFFQKVDIVTFESEFYDASLIEKISDSLQVKVMPSANSMSLLQDRLSQKQIISRHLDTAEFCELNSLEELPKLFEKFSNGFVVKKRLGGYDGNGTYVIRNQMDLIRMSEVLKEQKSSFIAEAFIPFEKEMALMVARNEKGQIQSFPLVESRQLQNRCDLVFGPAQHFDLDRVMKGIYSFLNDLQYVGVMGIEMFASAKSLIVNEVAPRVHNSGHFSQNCCQVDQFQMHLLAILNENLPTPRAFAPSFAMKNLIGSTDRLPKIIGPLQGCLHWYGKKENRMGRKMGHLNYAGSSTEELKQFIQDDLKNIVL